MAICLVAACSPTYNWRELRPDAAGVQLLFPCRPSTAQRSVALAGALVKLTVHSCQAGNQTWGLSYAQVDDPGRVNDVLGGLQAAAARNIGAPAGAIAEQPVPGASPQARNGRLRLDGALPDGKVVRIDTLLFAKGSWVFQASAIGEAAPSEAIETFLGSIRFAR